MTAFDKHIGFALELNKVMYVVIRIKKRAE